MFLKRASCCPALLSRDTQHNQPWPTQVPAVNRQGQVRGADAACWALPAAWEAPAWSPGGTRPSWRPSRLLCLPVPASCPSSPSPAISQPQVPSALLGAPCGPAPPWDQGLGLPDNDLHVKDLFLLLRWLMKIKHLLSALYKGM